MQISKWLVPAAAAALGCGVVARSASADTLLYTSHGFESSAGYTALTELPGNATTGAPAQPVGATDPWARFANTANTAVAGTQAYVEPYLDGSGQQYVEVIGQNLAPATDFGYYYPTTYTSTPHDATGQQIAVRYSMRYQATGTNAVVGVTGFAGDVPVGVAGVNGLGKIYTPTGMTLTTAGTNFTATSGLAYQYELLLDYAAQKYSVFEAPADNVSPYVLMGSGDFLNPGTDFTDADLSVFAADRNSATLVTGYGFFDDYTVSVVPEPTALSGMALCLLAGYRRRRSA